MTSERQFKHYVSRERIGKENSTPLLLFPVKSNAAFTTDAISELFHSPSSMCFILLKFASFLFIAFSTKSGFNLISDESYVSQTSPGDLIKAEYIWVIDHVRELTITRYWPSPFLTSLVIKGFIIWTFKNLPILWDPAHNPKKARQPPYYTVEKPIRAQDLVCLTSPTYGACHIINVGICATTSVKYEGPTDLQSWYKALVKTLS